MHFNGANVKSERNVNQERKRKDKQRNTKINPHSLGPCRSVVPSPTLAGELNQPHAQVVWPGGLGPGSRSAISRPYELLQMADVLRVFVSNKTYFHPMEENMAVSLPS